MYRSISERPPWKSGESLSGQIWKRAHRRLRIGKRGEALEMPESEFANAKSNLAIWFSGTGEEMRYRVVRSSGDTALDLRMVRRLQRRAEPPRGLVEVEWREER